MRRVLQISLVLGAGVFISALLIFEIHNTPSLSKVRRIFKPSVRIVLDRDGQIIDQIRRDRTISGHRLPWISLTQLPPHFREMLKAAHPGSLSFATSALVQDLFGQANSWFKTWALKCAWTDEQILEAFVNLSVFNDDLQGMSTVSFSLYDKPVQDLSRSETAVVLALLRSRLGRTEELRREACRIVSDSGSPETCPLITSQHLTYLAKSFNIQPYTKLAPHLARVLSQQEQLRSQTLLRSTLDRDAQWTALNALQMSGSEGAIIAIENSTGNVLVYVGNMGAQSKNSYRNGMNEPHSSSSMLKPFAYAQALDEHVVTLNTGIETSPRSVEPGLVSVRKALSANMNVPAIRIVELVGSDSFLRKLESLGFASSENPDFFGPSVILGSYDVSLMELANAYRALANNGLWSPVRFSPDLISEVAPRSALSRGSAYLIADILSQNLRTPYWSAGQCLENWCVGFSEKYTVGVWNQGQAAGSIWLKVMDHLQREERGSPPVRPDTLVRVGTEDYLKGTEPDLEIHGRPKGLGGYKSRISFPLDQSLIAIAPENKKSGMFIQVVAPRSDQNLYLNGRRLGRAQSLQAWEPEAGKYTLELRDSQGQILDKVHFKVRGRRFAQIL